MNQEKEIVQSVDAGTKAEDEMPKNSQVESDESSKTEGVEEALDVEAMVEEAKIEEEEK